jgi:adenylosuccinate synthase
MARLLFAPEENLGVVWDNWIRAVLKGCENAWRLADVSVLGDADYVIGEGAQGILLDEWVGFHPHTTWTDCTPASAVELLKQAGLNRPRLVGVLRAHGCRHGAGPFPGERASLPDLLVGEHNNLGPWQGKFRVGLADMPLLRYALKVTGPLDELWIRHLDRVKVRPSLIAAYAENVETQLNPPSRVLSEGEALRATGKMAALLGNDLGTVNVREFNSPGAMAHYIRALANCPEGKNTWSASE